MPSFDGMESFDVFLESALDQILLGSEHFRILGDRTRPLISIYIGKGVLRPLPFSIFQSVGFPNTLSTENIVLIKRSWPVSRRNLYSLLASSKILISFDPFSHIERVSTMLGTPVLKMCRYNLRELPGVSVPSKNSVSNFEFLSSAVEVRSSSLRSYHEACNANDDNLSSTVSAILSLADSSYSHPNSTKLIPFSKRTLHSFSSQLRGLLPYMGAVNLPRLNESLSSADVFQLINPMLSSAESSSNVLSYNLLADRISLPCIYNNSSSHSTHYFHYLRHLGDS